MSEPLRIALVAEGPTDYEVIAAALRAVLKQPFVMTLLQPEATQPQFGGGWGGVLKWCYTTSRRHSGPLSQDPTLSLFDLIILHLDADVAAKHYADCGPAVAKMAHACNWKPLPCHRPCPPAADTCIALLHVLTAWLAPATVPEYRRQSLALTSRWELVKQLCTQASAFERAVLTTTTSLQSRQA